MKVKSKKNPGYVDGTSNTVTGDRMKEGDLRRSKIRCKYYHYGYCKYKKMECTCVSYCEHYDDGRDPFIIDNAAKILDDRLPCQYYEQGSCSRLKMRCHGFSHCVYYDNGIPNSYNIFFQSLLEYIPLDSLEGSIIKKLILKQIGLSESDFELLENQKKQYRVAYQNLAIEIKNYNDRLKEKCTFWFFFLRKKYEREMRILEDEALTLNKIIDKELEKKIEIYKKRITGYGKKINAIESNYGDNYYYEGKLLFLKKDYKNALPYFKKSIQNNEVATLFNMYLLLADNTDKNATLNINSLYALLLFASFSGNAIAKKKINERLNHTNNPTTYVIKDNTKKSEFSTVI